MREALKTTILLIISALIIIPILGAIIVGVSTLILASIYDTTPARYVAIGLLMITVGGVGAKIVDHLGWMD